MSVLSLLVSMVLNTMPYTCEVPELAAPGGHEWSTLSESSHSLAWLRPRTIHVRAKLARFYGIEYHAIYL